MRNPWIALAALLLAACAGNMAVAPAETAPASAETARVDPASTLHPDEFDAPAATSVAEVQKARGPDTAAHGMYVCPMHPEVTSDKPGTCPKCGMTLVKKE